MSDPEITELYDGYVAAYRAGRPDPAPFTGRLEGADRKELEALIGLFLDQAPPTEFDEAAYRESFSAKMSAEVAASLSGMSGQLPVVLTRMRRQQKILVDDVERQLAEALGANGDEEQEKVRDYYHQLEYGTLPAKPVSDQVFEALARIYRTSAEKLRAAGEALGPQPDHMDGPVYARVAGVDYQEGMASPGTAPSDRLADAEMSVAERLRAVKTGKQTFIDELFLGRLS